MRRSSPPHDDRPAWLKLLPHAGEPTFVAGALTGYIIDLPQVFELAPVLNAWLAAAHDGHLAETAAEVSDAIRESNPPKRAEF